MKPPYFENRGGRLYLQDNSPANPSFELCVPPGINVLDDRSCKVNVEGSGPNECNVACGFPGEVANDKSLGHIFPFSTGQIAREGGYDTPYDFNGWLMRSHGGPVKPIIWTHMALGAPDQLRQRVAWAISQICVAGLTGTWDDFYQEAYDTKQWEVVELHISGLGLDADDGYVRNLCQGFDLQIVKVNADVDPVRNLCKGRAKVMVRYNPKRDSISGLVRKLEASRLRVEL